MSKLSELIAELCPNGVEHKILADILIYEQPGNYIVHTTDYDDSFGTPVLTAGKSFVLGYTNESDGVYAASADDPVIIFDDFTATFHWVDFPFKVKSSAIKMLRSYNGNVAMLRYVYYAMKCIRYVPTDHARHYISEYSNFKIPLPPLKIQQEIVKILDKFTELQAELQAELDLRLKQYEYYRDELLSFDKLSNLAGVVRRVRLGEVAKYSVARISADLVDDSTYVGVDNLLPDKRGKINSSHVPTAGYLTKFVAGDVLIGNIRPYLRKIWLADIDGGTNGDVLSIHVVDKLLNSRFLYYVLSSERFFTYSVNNSKGAKMPRGDRRSIMEYEFTIPSLNAQQKIVEVLDRFSSITTSLTNGLPAEIKLRQQQYEYYRDELLSFKLTNV